MTHNQVAHTLNTTHLLIAAAAGAALTVITWKLTKWIYSRKGRTHIPRVSILECVGDTPLIYLPRLSEACGAEIYVRKAKAEFMNPFGSNKDRIAKWILEAAARRGAFNQHKEIIQASSGSTAISLSSMAHILGVQPTIYLPNDIAEEKLNLLRLIGAKVISVPPALIIDPKHYYNLARSNSFERGVCFSDQFENPANAQAHYESTGPEIFEQTLGLLDSFVCSVGTGGTLAGVSKYLKEKNPQILIVLADPQGSGLHNKVKYGVLYTGEEREGYRKKNPFDSITEGIGLNRPTHNFEAAIIDQSYKVTDEQALHLSLYLIQNEGLLLGSSSAVNLAACIKHARKHPGSRIVTMLHDSGLRYISKFYSKKYLEDKGIKFAARPSYPADDVSFVL